MRRQEVLRFLPNFVNYAIELLNRTNSASLWQEVIVTATTLPSAHTVPRPTTHVDP